MRCTRLFWAITFCKPYCTGSNSHTTMKELDFSCFFFGVLQTSFTSLSFSALICSQLAGKPPGEQRRELAVFRFSRVLSQESSEEAPKKPRKEEQRQHREALEEPEVELAAWGQRCCLAKWNQNGWEDPDDAGRRLG